MIKPNIAAVVALIVLSACSASGDVEPTASNGLAGSTWRLAELQSNDDAIGIVRPDDPSKYEMRFSADGRVALRLDCNRGAGQWQSPAPGQITFTPLAMTRAACPTGSLDTRVARELEYVRTYMLDGNRLRLLMMADGGSQVWVRHPE